MRAKIGVVHGRFQPFHIGHLDYVSNAKQHCDFLYVGIANPDPSLTRAHEANTARANPSSNPFTFFERQAMIKTTLIDHGFSPSEFELVPFPINYPEYIRFYTPTTATYFITIYDQWGYAKKQSLESVGLKVVVLQEGNKELKLAEGTHIRKLIAQGGDWKPCVPDRIAKYLVENELLEKIEQLV